MQPNPTAPPDYEPKGPPPAYDVVCANNATNSTPVQFQPQLQPQQVQVQPPRVVILEFGEDPVLITCPYCNSSTTTRTEHQLGLMSWLLFLTSILWLFCVSIVCLCCDFNQDVLHYCSHCNRMIGRYRRPCTSKIVLITIVCIVAFVFILGTLNTTQRYS